MGNIIFHNRYENMNQIMEAMAAVSMQLDENIGATRVEYSEHGSIKTITIDEMKIEK